MEHSTLQLKIDSTRSKTESIALFPGRISDEWSEVRNAS